MMIILPLGGKYDLLSALCGQSTTTGPNFLKLADISSTNTKHENDIIRVSHKLQTSASVIYHWIMALCYIRENGYMVVYISFSL